MLASLVTSVCPIARSAPVAPTYIRFTVQRCVLTTMASPPNIISIHTPSASFAIVHSSMSSPSTFSLFLIIGLVNEDSLEHLFDKLSRKSHTDFHGQRVGPGWIKYHWNDTFWNLDDGRSLVLCNIGFVN